MTTLAERAARARDRHWIDVLLATIERQPDGSLEGRCRKCGAKVTRIASALAHWHHTP